MKALNPILAAASLIGTIIGAGVFAIPYVVSQSGIFISLFCFIFLGAIVLFLHLFYGEVVLRTEGRHQLTGYAKKYLGEGSKRFVAATTIIGTIGSLLVYIILAGDFLRLVSPFNFSSWQGSLIFWFFLAVVVFYGIKSIAIFEFLMSAGMAVIFFLIFIFCAPKIQAANYVFFNYRYLFLPFGVLLFSLVGWNSIPEIMDVLKNKSHLKKVILYSCLFCLLVYILFGFLVAGVTGPASGRVFEDLAPFLGHWIIFLGGILGLLAVGTSFIISANYLKNTFCYDLGLFSRSAFLLAIGAPMLLFLFGFNAFIPVVGFVGSFMGLAEGAAIVLIYQKAKKAGDRLPEYSLRIPQFLIFLIVFALVVSIIAEMLNMFVIF